MGSETVVSFFTTEVIISMAGNWKGKKKKELMDIMIHMLTRWTVMMMMIYRLLVSYAGKAFRVLS